MDRAGYSNLIELKNYGQASQSDAELGMSQDERSCGTRAFKWVVRHPYLATAAAIGLVGVASGGIYGLTLLGAAAPVTTALSGRSVTLSGAGIPDVTTLSGRNITINSNTTATTTTKAPTVEATTTKAPTTEATTTKAP
uniref:hypothetical protein n=1 Tax=Endozoicomonas sp. SESOKO1 TaxID=2828742 RepID=UPI0021473E4B